MKKLFILMFILLSRVEFNSQCQFMPERDFEAAKYRLSGNRGNINTFQAAMDLTRTYCLSSNQAREIANYLANDRDKFDFLKSSYPNITDKENYTNVMDVFRLFSSAVRLYHETMGASRILQPFPQPISTNPNCPRAMEQHSYNQLRSQITNLGDDRQKASIILNAANQCMHTQQIENLVSSISDENIRFDVLKRLHPFVFDIENYSQASSILSSTYRTQFLAFLGNPKAPSEPSIQQQSAALSEIDFTSFLNSIRKQSFEKDKDNYIKTYMKNAYLNVAQVKQVLKLLNFDATKLDIAKFLYNRCTDKQNYFQVSNELQFSSSKTELNDYVNSHQ